MRKPAAQQRGGVRRFAWLAGPAVALMTLAGAPSASAVAAALGPVTPRPVTPQPVAPRLVPPGPGPAATRFGALRLAPARFDQGGQAVTRHGNLAQAGGAGASIVLDGSPGTPAANPRTGTVYVPIQCAASGCPAQNGHVVDVINAAKCKAKIRSDCRVVARAAVGNSPLAVVVDEATDTLYVTNGNDGTVAVINGATCNGTDHAGCGSLAATAKVGRRPVGAAVNDRTHSVYVINNANGDLPGTVSVINGATCNGTDTGGCGAHLPVMPAGRSPVAVTLDATTGFVYVADFSSAAVSVLNGSRCNPETAVGCGAAAREQPVGSGPQGITLNQRTHTVYVADLYQPGFMSIFTAQH
jgi:DNA-binding beta-propeller fold protein YncE